MLAVLASPRSRRGALERLNVKPRERETEKQKSEEGGVYSFSDRSRQKKKKKKVFAFLFAHSLPFSSCLTSDAPHARPGDRARGRVVVVAEGERRECGRNGDGEEGDTGGGSSGDDEATTANNSLGLQHLVLLRELHRPVAPRRGCSLGFDLLQQERYGGQLKRSGGGTYVRKKRARASSPPTVAILPASARLSSAVSRRCFVFQIGRCWGLDALFSPLPSPPLDMNRRDSAFC